MYMYHVLEDACIMLKYFYLYFFSNGEPTFILFSKRLLFSTTGTFLNKYENLTYLIHFHVKQ